MFEHFFFGTISFNKIFNHLKILKIRSLIWQIPTLFFSPSHTAHCEVLNLELLDWYNLPITLELWSAGVDGINCRTVECIFRSRLHSYECLGITVGFMNGCKTGLFTGSTEACSHVQFFTHTLHLQCRSGFSPKMEMRIIGQLCWKQGAVCEKAFCCSVLC